MVFYLLTNKLNLSKLRLNGEQPTHHLSSYDLWHLEWCHTRQIHAVFVAVQSVGSVDKLIESVEQKPFNNFQKRFQSTHEKQLDWQKMLVFSLNNSCFNFLVSRHGMTRKKHGLTPFKPFFLSARSCQSHYLTCNKLISVKIKNCFIIEQLGWFCWLYCYVFLASPILPKSK